MTGIVDLARGMKGKRPQRIVDQFNFVRQEELELSTPAQEKEGEVHGPMRPETSGWPR